ncbi:hypothetical protein HELRODRAFT_172012 [Helobdella robusta]|uniref:Glycosyltransferase family 92 protein n=1 Tax=Helobdella robusta TaxID=6412 RepID=T1F4X8_HELRO|nr:hypothetical protein HELRODRAFT_172012 [Helobdella robusta]ESO05000.1 hypothetical protein HELRODRAFT_172012 [Helobdella robusta]
MRAKIIKIKICYKICFASILTSFFAGVVVLHAKLTFLNICSVPIQTQTQRSECDPDNFGSQLPPSQHSPDLFINQVKSFLMKDDYKLRSLKRKQAKNHLRINYNDDHQTSHTDNYTNDFRFYEKYENEFKPFGKHFIFSAYFDDRVESINNDPSLKINMFASAGLNHVDVNSREELLGYVRVIALMEVKQAMQAVYCHYSDEPVSNFAIDDKVLNDLAKLVEGDIYEMCENHKKEFGGYIITCPLPNNFNHTTMSASFKFGYIPKYVTLIYGTERVSEVNDSQSEKTRSKTVIPEEISEIIVAKTHRNSSGVYFMSKSIQKVIPSNASSSFTKHKTDKKLLKMRKVTKRRYTKSFYVEYVRISSRRRHQMFSSAKYHFGICVPPVHKKTLTASKLIDFIETHLLLGVDHFIMYIKPDLPDELKDALDYYKEVGICTLIPWNLPQTNFNIWSNGQLLAANDCLYRFMYKFEYLAFVDIDEFIIPVASASWDDMISRLENSTHCTTNGTAATSPAININNNTDDLGEFLGLTFLRSKCVVFYLASAFIHQLVDSSLHGYNLESDLRVKIFSRVRTKVIVSPKFVLEMGIHHVNKIIQIKRKLNNETMELYINDTAYQHKNVSQTKTNAVNLLKSFEISTDIAYIHHFRRCTRTYDPNIECNILRTDKTFAPILPELRVRTFLVLWYLRERQLRQARNETESNKFLVV